MDDLICAQMKLLSDFERVKAKDLLEGAKNIKICVFSATLPFIPKFLNESDEFETAEIIVGNGGIKGSQDLARALVAQTFLVTQLNKLLKKNKKLMELVDTGRVTFYIPNNGVIHSKFYLMENHEENIYRTVVSSGNMSKKAWEGAYYDLFMFSEDHNTYNVFKNQWDDLMDLCNKYAVVKDVLEASPVTEPDIEDLPICKEIEVKKSIVLEKVEEGVDVQYYVAATTGSIQKKVNVVVKDVNVTKAADSYLIDPGELEKLKYAWKKYDEEAEKKAQIALSVSFDDEGAGSVWLNDKELDLGPDISEVKNDLKLFLEFTNGASMFTGNTSDLRTVYWKVLNYFFVSPFLSILARTAAENDFSTEAYPMYALLQGESDAGKSTELGLLYSMMLGSKKKIIINAGNQFTGSKAKEIQSANSCLPVCFDDIQGEYFKYAYSVMKSPRILLDKSSDMTPAIIFTSNKSLNIKPEVSKRMMIFSIDNRLPVNLKHKTTGKITRIKKKMGNALFRYYMGKMLPKIYAMLEDMKHGNLEVVPDVFKASSETLIGICGEILDTLPEGLEIFTHIELMGEAAIGRNARTYLISHYNFDKNTGGNGFYTKKIDGALYLFVDMSVISDSKSRPKDTEFLVNTLPARLEVQKYNECLRMKFKETQEFLGMKIKVKKKFGFF